MGLPEDLMPAEGEAVVIMRSGESIFFVAGNYEHFSLDRRAGTYCTCAPEREAALAREEGLDTRTMDEPSRPPPCYAELDLSLIARPDGVRRQSVESFERELRGIPLPAPSGDSVPAPERVTIGAGQPA